MCKKSSFGSSEYWEISRTAVNNPVKIVHKMYIKLWCWSRSLCLDFG